MSPYQQQPPSMQHPLQHLQAPPLAGFGRGLQPQPPMMPPHFGPGGMHHPLQHPLSAAPPPLLPPAPSPMLAQQEHILHAQAQEAAARLNSALSAATTKTAVLSSAQAAAARINAQLGLAPAASSSSSSAASAAPSSLTPSGAGTAASSSAAPQPLWPWAQKDAHAAPESFPDEKAGEDEYLKLANMTLKGLRKLGYKGGPIMGEKEAGGLRFGLHRAGFNARGEFKSIRMLVGLEIEPCQQLHFNVLERLKGPANSYFIHIMRSCPGILISVNGRGTAVDSEEPLHLRISSDHEGLIRQAQALADSLISTVKAEFDAHALRLQAPSAPAPSAAAAAPLMQLPPPLSQHAPVPHAHMQPPPLPYTPQVSAPSSGLVAVPVPAPVNVGMAPSPFAQHAPPMQSLPPQMLPQQHPSQHYSQQYPQYQQPPQPQQQQLAMAAGPPHYRGLSAVPSAMHMHQQQQQHQPFAAAPPGYAHSQQPPPVYAQQLPSAGDKRKADSLLDSSSAHQSAEAAAAGSSDSGPRKRPRFAGLSDAPTVPIAAGDAHAAFASSVNGSAPHSASAPGLSTPAAAAANSIANSSSSSSSSSTTAASGSDVYDPEADAGASDDDD